jgi:hypothetical protein
MSKRVIFINWSFDEDEWEGNNCKKFRIIYNEELVDDCLIYASNFYINDLDKFSNMLNDKIIKHKHDFVMILLHKTKENNKPSPILHKHIHEMLERIDKIKCKEFGGGAGAGQPIYYDDTVFPLGILEANDFEPTAIINDNDELFVKLDNFEFVWDMYWNRLELEYQKRQIINLWLPFAIDIQGLSEVKDKKRNGYLNEVYSEIQGDEYIQELSNKWEQIKEILVPSSNIEVLESDYMFDDDEKESVIFPGNIISVDRLKKIIEIKLDSQETRPLFPNWLKNTIKTIDEKIKPSSI